MVRPLTLRPTTTFRVVERFAVADFFCRNGTLTGSDFFRAVDFFIAVVFFRAVIFLEADRSAIDLGLFLLVGRSVVRSAADFLAKGFAFRAVAFLIGVGAMIVVFTPSPPRGCRTRLCLVLRSWVILNGNEMPRTSGALTTLISDNEEPPRCSSEVLARVRHVSYTPGYRTSVFHQSGAQYITIRSQHTHVVRSNRKCSDVHDRIRVH